MIRLRPFLLCACLLICCIATAHAQKPTPPPPPPPAPGPPELNQLEKQYALRALTAGRTLADQYSNALAGLEQTSADAGDYETALAAQRRRHDLADLYAKLPESTADDTVLHPADAKTSGAVIFSRGEDALTSWRTAGSGAYWDVTKITPGEFDVSISYGVSDAAEGTPRSTATSRADDLLTGGDLEFFEVTGLGTGEGAKLIASVAPTGGWNKYTTLNLGTLRLSRASARLTLSVARTRGSGGVMHLKEIRLSPARPHEVKPDSTASDDFAKMRSDHQERLRALEQPIVDSYKAKLNTVAQQFTAAKDDENADAAKLEAQRADHALAQAASSAHPGAQIMTATEGLEEIRDATFIDAPSNTGDHFLISANDQQISVRLMWVTCPSPLAEDAASLKSHAQYFGISEDDTVVLGRQAQEFTAAYLKDKPLRVFTRWQKDKNGAVYASIHPAELGDFAGILVDNGLAAINPPTAKPTVRRRTDETAVAVLKEREAAAQAKPLPPGAWSLSNGKPPQ